MKKLLKPADVLKLGLAGALDIFEEIRDPLGIMAQGCRELYGWVPERYKRHNFFRTVSRSLKTGDITKIVKGGRVVYLRLTSQGKEKIKRDFPLLSFQKKSWDSKWRVIFYDISEANKRVRERFREKLKDLGFGMIQRSVWITPHDLARDLREFIEANKLGEEVFVLEAPHLLAGDPRVLASKVWQLDKLNKEYKKIYQEIEKLKETYVGASDRMVQRTEEKEEGRRKRVREIRSRYLEVLLTDPFLPRELLPDDWMGERVREEVKRLGKMS